MFKLVSRLRASLAGESAVRAPKWSCTTRRTKILRLDIQSSNVRRPAVPSGNHDHRTTPRRGQQLPAVNLRRTDMMIFLR